MFGICKKEEPQIKSAKEPVPLQPKSPVVVRYPRCTREMATLFEAQWDAADILPGKIKEVESAADLCRSGFQRYDAVSRAVNIPWQIIAVIHKMEGGCDFRACLHNGERIIGTQQKTKLVPKNRGPFQFWEDAAIDAINLEHKIPDGFEFDIANTMYFLTAYNGFGYYNRGLVSPYLWSYTNLYSKGKYVSDGNFDPNAVSKQCGAIPILWQLGFKPHTWD